MKKFDGSPLPDRMSDEELDALFRNELPDTSAIFTRTDTSVFNLILAARTDAAKETPWPTSLFLKAVESAFASDPIPYTELTKQSIRRGLAKRATITQAICDDLNSLIDFEYRQANSILQNY